MKGTIVILISLVLLVPAAILASEPWGTSPSNVSDIMRAIVEIKNQNSELIARVGEVERKLKGIPVPRSSTTSTSEAGTETQTRKVTKYDPFKEGPVSVNEDPMIDIMLSQGGRWMIDPQSGQEVFASSRWRIRSAGKAKIYELIEYKGRPIGVPVFHGDMDAGSQRRAARQQPTYSYQFGGGSQR